MHQLQLDITRNFGGRLIYGESISALPMNGGAYNVLINATSKPVASFAACLAVISYIATGVVSAATAVSYLQVLTLSIGNKSYVLR